jgi:hypothetical protein
MFSIEFGDFLNNSLSFGFNIEKKIFLFLHVFDFPGPSVKRTQYFCRIKIKNREKKSTGNATRAKR